MTLAELINQHPEYADLPITVMRTDGELDYVDAAASYFVVETDDEGPVLVFAQN